jgi:hypothetical protein
VELFVRGVAEVLVAVVQDHKLGLNHHLLSVVVVVEQVLPELSIQGAEVVARDSLDTEINQL